MVKFCNGCQQKLPINDFAWKYKAKNIRQHRCRSCMRVHARARYLANRQHIIAEAVKRKEVNKVEISKRIIEYLLAHPCVDCGEADPVVLTFDHFRDKIANVCAMLRDFTWDVVLAEIEKCNVRCSNCHLKRHAKEGNWITYRLLQEMKR